MTGADEVAAHRDDITIAVRATLSDLQQRRESMISARNLAWAADQIAAKHSPSRLTEDWVEKAARAIYEAAVPAHRSPRAFEDLSEDDNRAWRSAALAAHRSLAMAAQDGER